MQKLAISVSGAKSLIKELRLRNIPLKRQPGIGSEFLDNTILIGKESDSPIQSLFHESGHLIDMDVKKRKYKGERLLGAPHVLRSEIHANTEALKLIKKHERPEKIKESILDYKDNFIKWQEGQHRLYTAPNFRNFIAKQYQKLVK